MEPEFRILGPCEITVDGRRLDPGGPRTRRLLAVLLLHVGEHVPVDRLVDAVWEERPPPGAMTTLRRHVANLRRSLDPVGAADLVVTGSRGYRLAVDPTHVDAVRFERLVDAGRGALDDGDAGRAADVLRAASTLWRGRVLQDLDSPRFAEVDEARLEELRVMAVEMRIDAELCLGRHRELVGEIRSLADAHPFRERIWGQLMVALYRSGRQADAIAVAQDLRARLDEELGLVPGPELSDLETAILRQDPALELVREPAASAPSVDVLPRSGRRVTSDSPAADPLLAMSRRVPMVGRNDELERLHGLWRAVRSGERGVALLGGEAGVGKTRLVAELVCEAEADGAVVLVGRCELTGSIPYRSVSDALRASPPVVNALIETGDSDGADPSDGADDGRTAMFDEVVGHLVHAAATTPIVLVIEDAETIDRASVHLLRHLVRRLPARFLLLVCFRDPPGGRHRPLQELLADVAGAGVAERVTLRPLDRSGLAALVAVIAPEVHRVGSDASVDPHDLIDRVWSVTGGNPLFAGEVIRDLVARGDLGEPWTPAPTPAAVQDVLRDRLQAVADHTREIITCAAVLGPRIDLDLLIAVAGEPEERVADALEEAVDAGWLVETDRTSRAAYTFRHPLMHQAVHEDLPVRRRQRLHLRAADAIDATDPHRSPDLAALAAHLQAAGLLADPVRTAVQCLRAADAAAALYAWDEAIGHAETAVRTLELGGADPCEQARAASRAGDLLWRSTLDYPRAIEHVESALRHHRDADDPVAAAEVCSRLGRLLSSHYSVMDVPRALDQFAAARSVLTDDAAAFEVDAGIALTAMYGLRTAEPVAAADRAVACAETMGRRDLVASVRPAQAVHRFNAGELASARALVEDAWATAQDLGDPHLGWWAASAGAMIETMYLLDPTRGARWCRRALAMPRFETIRRAHQGVHDQLAFAMASLGELADAGAVGRRLPPDAVSRRHLRLLDGDWESVDASWTTALARDLDRGDRMNAVLNAVWVGQVRGRLGRRASAIRALQEGLTMSCDGQQVPAEVMVRAELSRVLALDGDAAHVDEARRHLARCDDILAGGEDWRGQVGNVDLAQGLVAAACGDHEQAGAAFGSAVERFETFRLPWWRAHTIQAWAASLREAGRAAEAAEMRHAARTVFEELGAHERWRREVA